MTLIEGIGDEVVQFFFVVVCVLTAILAWVSTGHRPDRFRTVVIMERNHRAVTQRQPVTVNIRRNVGAYNILRGINATSTSESNVPVAAEAQTTIDTQNTISGPEPSDGETEVAVSDTEERGSEEQAGVSRPDQAQEMNSIVNAMDAEANVIRHRRLAFFKGGSDGVNREVTPQTVCTNVSTPPSRGSHEINLPRNLQKIINQHPTGTDSVTLTDEALDDMKVEGNLNVVEETVAETKSEDGNENQEASGDTTEEVFADSVSTDNIRIRLKYLNDDLKLVEGSLEEPLREFKLRHFTSELSTRQLVRLIFNGRVLAREADTLRACGFYDNCVVHCLVHQPRNQQQQNELNETLYQTQGNERTEQTAEAPPATEGSTEQETTDQTPWTSWDMEKLLLVLITSIFTLAWYCQWQYPSLFSTTASLALAGLTMIYGLALMGVYFPDPVIYHSISVHQTSRSNNAPQEAVQAN